jgi:hypothetical protein
MAAVHYSVRVDYQPMSIARLAAGLAEHLAMRGGQDRCTARSATVMG